MEKVNILEYLESRLRDNPKSLLFARLADVYLEQGKTDDAMVLCIEGVKHHPYYSTGYYVLAKTHVLKKEYDKAEGALKKVLSHDQQYLAAHKLLADIMVKTGWESTAVEHYSAVLEIDPLEDKIRGLARRYAAKPAPKSPLLGPTEDPVTALEDLAVLETKTRASAPVKAETAPEVLESAPPTPPAAPAAQSEQSAPPAVPVRDIPPMRDVPAESAGLSAPEPRAREYEPLPDWTDQITEFHPDEEDLTPLTPSPASETGFGAAAEPPEYKAGGDFGDDFFEKQETESAPLESPAPDVPAVSAMPSDARAEPGEIIREKPPAAREQAPDEKLVDFTQDWFDLSSFENIEAKQPKKKESSEPPLEIVDAGPGPGPGPAESPAAASENLFQKEVPREILTPADLSSAADEVPKAVPPPKPAEAAAPPAGRKRPEFLMPAKNKSKAAEPVSAPSPAESVSREEKKPQAGTKPDEKPEPKIVTSTLGEIYAVQGQFDKAIQVYEALLEKNPNEQKYLDKIADLKKKLREASGK